VKHHLTKLTKLHKSEALKNSRFSRANLVIFAVIFVAIGGYFIYSSFAAGAACTQTVSTGVNLANTVSSAANGAVICLNDGNYGSLNLFDISKSSYVTLRSVNSKGATLGGTQIGNTDFIRIEDVNIGGGLINSCSQHIQIANSTFTSGLAMRDDNGCTPITNLDITLDGNSFNNLLGATWEGRLSLGGTIGNPSGITIKNNTFGVVAAATDSKLVAVREVCKSLGIFLEICPKAPAVRMSMLFSVMGVVTVQSLIATTSSTTKLTSATTMVTAATSRLRTIYLIHQ
jgi:hypothetical protein